MNYESLMIPMQIRHHLYTQNQTRFLCVCVYRGMNRSNNEIFYELTHSDIMACVKNTLEKTYTIY